MAEQDIQVQSNGHKEIPDDVGKFLGMDTFGGMFTSQQVASAIEKFVERGEKVEDLILRGHFRSINHMNATMRLYRKAVHFKDTELQALLLNHMAGYPAIDGRRIDILLQAVTGQYPKDRELGIGSRLKRIMGIRDDK